MERVSSFRRDMAVSRQLRHTNVLPLGMLLHCKVLPRSLFRRELKAKDGNRCAAAITGPLSSALGL